MQTVLFIVEIMLSIAIMLTFIRIVRGPTMANKVIALDLLGSLGAGLMASEAIRTGEHALIDVAIVVGIAAFIGTTAFALLINRDPGVRSDS